MLLFCLVVRKDRQLAVEDDSGGCGSMRYALACSLLKLRWEMYHYWCLVVLAIHICKAITITGRR